MMLEVIPCHHHIRNSVIYHGREFVNHTNFMLTSKLMDSSMKLHPFILHNKTKLLQVNLPYLQASSFLLEFLTAQYLFTYINTSEGYRCYDPIGKCHYTTMDATFLESKSYYSLSTTSDPQRATWNEDLKW
ncbi:hypothetical protein CR513_42501, partial [Mucuna pruriens]